MLGFRWTAHPLTSQGSGPGGSAVTAGSMCCSLDGQLVLVSAANEIARLAVVADCALPVPPASLYNARLAAAALEAAARRTASGAGGYPARPDSQASQQPPAAGLQQEEGGPSNAFGRFFDQAASTVTGLATTAAGTVMQVSGVCWCCCCCFCYAMQPARQHCAGGPHPSCAAAPVCSAWQSLPCRLHSACRSWTGRGRWGRVRCSA